MRAGKAPPSPALLIDLPKDGPGPLQTRLFEALRRAILEGRLAAEKPLPSTRALAEQLSISRNTVVAVYELLTSEGYIAGRQGSGSYVLPTIPDRFLAAPQSHTESGKKQVTRRKSRLAAELMSNAVASGKHVLFDPALAALEAFPIDLWSRLVAKHSRRLSRNALGYASPHGLLSLREAVAEYLRLARGVRCDPDQIFVVSGSQQGLNLVCAALLDPGAAVAVEDPGYPGARAAFRMARTHMTPVPVDDEGLNIAALQRAKHCQLAYVTPSHQYPLGVTMSLDRRLQLLDWAAKKHSWIVEDDYDSEYRYHARPLSSLQGLDRSDSVLFLGTFSKVLFPALRIGYLVVPKNLVPVMLRVREALDIFPSSLNQAALAEFITEGHFARHVRRMRVLYAQRQKWLLHSLERYASGWLEPGETGSGLHLAAFLKAGIKDTDVFYLAAERGINAKPLSQCYLGKKKRQGLILGFGGGDRASIFAAAEKLGKVIREVAKSEKTD